MIFHGRRRKENEENEDIACLWFVWYRKLFIKIALPLISRSLRDLFNMSLFSRRVPTDWKIVRVAPIYKSGARDDCSNYRPNSMLPVLSRAFKKVDYNQLYDYLDSNRLIYKHQSGFQSLHSVVTSLMCK